MNAFMLHASNLGKSAQQCSRFLCLAGITVILSLSTASAAYLYVASGASGIQIQATIDSAVAGDCVIIQEGTNQITQALTFRDDITIRGDWWSNGETVLDASNLSSALDMTQTNLKNCNIHRLTFNNVQLTLAGNSSHSGNVGNRITHCTFQNVKSTNHIIKITYGADNIISNCDIQRDQKAFPGKGVAFYKAHGAQLLDSSITGYLVTALNILGFNEADANDLNHRCKDIVVDGNYMSRRYTSVEDHGIYAASYYNLQIRNNTIKFWTPTATGGSIKARNGDGLIIEDNTFHKSGVHLYVYDNALPIHLNSVRVARNAFYMSGGDSNGVDAIFYYRTTDDGAESSIRISDNFIDDGRIHIYGRFGAVSDDFNLNYGGVMKNQFTIEPLESCLDIPANVSVWSNSVVN